MNHFEPKKSFEPKIGFRSREFLRMQLPDVAKDERDAFLLIEPLGKENKKVKALLSKIPDIEELGIDPNVPESVDKKLGVIFCYGPKKSARLSVDKLGTTSYAKIEVNTYKMDGGWKRSIPVIIDEGLTYKELLKIESLFNGELQKNIGRGVLRVEPEESPPKPDYLIREKK